MTSATLPLQTSVPRTTASTRTGIFSRVFATSGDPALLVLRVMLGAVMLPHGAQKLLGMFGGYGFTGTMGFFTSQGIPYALGVLAIVAEFFGALGLITGFLSRIAAFGVASVMLVATLTVHLPNGFFMNWTGKQAGEGFEFHLLAIGIAVAIMIRGAGLFSVDRLISRKASA